LEFSGPDEIRFCRDGLDVRGLRGPLRSAGFPYWEVNPDDWARCIHSATELRIRLLRLDLPWVLHEPQPGLLDWGEENSWLDVRRVMQLAHACGLLVWVRPGPWLGRSFPGNGGLPDWLLAREEVLARQAHGRILPLPSPVSDGLLAESRIWLDNVSRMLEPYIWPAGPLVGWIRSGLGPERASWGGGILDRSHEALEFYERYRDEAAPSPGGPEHAGDLERALAWVRAGEQAEQQVLKQLAEPSAHETARLEELPVLEATRDHPLGAGCSPHGSEAAAVGLVMDASDPSEFGLIRRLGLRAADSSPAACVLDFAATRRRFSARPALEPATAAAVLAMSGVRALDLDSLVPRRSLEEVSAPLSDDGRIDRKAGWAEVFRMLDSIDHTSLERRSDLLLLANRECAHLREACAISGPVPAELGPRRTREALRVQARELSMPDHPELAHDRMFEDLFDGLRRSGIAFSLGDTSMCRSELARWKTILLVSFDCMSAELSAQLLDWVADGGTLILGPRLPSRQWSGAPLEFPVPQVVEGRVPSVQSGALTLEDVELLGGAGVVLECDAGGLASSVRFSRGHVIRFGFRFPWRSPDFKLDALAEIVRALLAPAGVKPCYPASDPAVETELHVGEERRFLFIANSAAEPCSITIQMHPKEALREVRGGGRHTRAGERMEIPPGTVWLREVVKL